MAGGMASIRFLPGNYEDLCKDRQAMLMKGGVARSELCFKE